MPQFESALDHLKSLDRVGVDSDEKSSIPHLFYTHDKGQLWLGDATEWLKTLPPESIDLVFADPPYNLKKAEWDTFESQRSYIDWSMQWIEQVARILKPTGTFYICGFSEILADLKLPASQYFQGCRWLIWHYKNKANLSNDWGRSHESILHFRKSKASTLCVENIRTRYNEHTLKYPNIRRLQRVNIAIAEKMIPNFGNLIRKAQNLAM